MICCNRKRSQLCTLKGIKDGRVLHALIEVLFLPGHCSKKFKLSYFVCQFCLLKKYRDSSHLTFCSKVVICKSRVYVIEGTLHYKLIMKGYKKNFQFSNMGVRGRVGVDMKWDSIWTSIYKFPIYVINHYKWRKKGFKQIYNFPLEGGAVLNLVIIEYTFYVRLKLS